MPYDHQQPDYWDAEALADEWRRTFEICHSCRLCFNLCPGFGDLFKTIDSHGDAEVAGLAPEDTDRFVDWCYQCKLCDVKCPYTPPHEWAIDIPGLALRARAVQARQRGVSLQDRFLGDPDRIGRMGGMLTPLMNWGNRNPLSRRMMEATLGVHHLRELPMFSPQSFAAWFAGAPKPSPDLLTNGKAVLFYTCTVNYNYPEIGRALCNVYWRNKVEVVVAEQRCCGMPALDGGDLEFALKSARFNIEQLLPWVEKGYTVVAPGPTCSYMLRKEYPRLLNTDAARAVAEHSRDACEFLMELHDRGALDTEFAASPGKVAYHIPCHLRAQNIGYRSFQLLNLTGAEAELIERCSGMDGTWGMKREHYEDSLKVAGRLFRQIEACEPDAVATDCNLAALQIKQGVKTPPQHPLQIVWQAYAGEAAAEKA